MPAVAWPDRGPARFSDPAGRGETYLRFKLDAFSLYYGNGNAWYGRPDLMLAGNPLMQGKAAGRGYDHWAEAYLHYGFYGITPLGEGLSFYGVLSAMTTWSQGQELFTDKTRSHTQVEDAYLGIVGGHVDGRGNRLVFNLTAGRQRFTLANGFLIANTAANGGERAALQANARWSSDLLVLGQIAYNDVKLEAFYLDPDELPLLDTDTRIGGLNLEATPLSGLSLGASYLTVPKSGANYFGPDGSVAGSRERLRVHDLRLAYQPNPAGASGPFFGAEIARQTHRNFDMDARAGWAELGYHFADARWAPTISYRVSYFSGDDPATSAYERWDPLLSGGTGEQWVQGVNHFKVVLDSNVVAHRIQARFKMSPRIEVVPQLWAFRADELNNIGGNPALSVLSDDELGYEANVTVKWFKSKNTYIHGHVAYTVPGSAAKAALGGSAKDWLSVMAFVRYAFRASGRSPPSPQKRGIPMSEPHDSAENLERRALLKVLGAAAVTGGLANPPAAETAHRRPCPRPLTPMRCLGIRRTRPCLGGRTSCRSPRIISFRAASPARLRWSLAAPAAWGA